MKMMGTESGSLRNTSGSQATSAISTPVPVRRRIYGSGIGRGFASCCRRANARWREDGAESPPRHPVPQTWK